MTKGTKIATCCYCGARTALVLRGKERHELSCASCGAPLHDMKMLRADKVVPEAHVPPQSGQKRPRPEVHATPLAHWEKAARSDKRRKKKRRKPLARRMFEEVFDLIEDVVD